MPIHTHEALAPIEALLPAEEDCDDESLYPSSDGEPMAESDLHQRVTIYCLHALTAWYRNQPLVYVTGDSFFYYKRGDSRAVVSPDVYVVPGAGNRLRDTYKLWREDGLTPSVVIEVTSKSTRDTDMTDKRTVYERTLKVPEYFLIDPTRDYIPETLRAYRLRDGVYDRLELAHDGVYSEQLGLILTVRADGFRLVDPLTGRVLTSSSEDAERAEAEQLRAEAEQLRADIATREWRAAEMRAEDEARERRAADMRAEEEARERRQAEMEIARLKAELEALRSSH